MANPRPRPPSFVIVSVTSSTTTLASLPWANAVASLPLATATPSLLNPCSRMLPSLMIVFACPSSLSHFEVPRKLSSVFNAAAIEWSVLMLITDGESVAMLERENCRRSHVDDTITLPICTVFMNSGVCFVWCASISYNCVQLILNMGTKLNSLRSSIITPTWLASQ